ncbi:tripartite tricarboxylate transporter substrate binding protein [Schauerella aestuarii]|uniref:tripartite tricarboxylate transporter substrate binding protein n=1 Tax=Schauerella aestuarii TaxID=2511204 RepID=UPI00136AEFEF|nr:tripartite tricarboxylate transporter substrate binding protein [Achromobacter aestuarii]MYZ43262.1 tripartite tricarboxylate transporter substrate binding protein [Achromobacter aestuarii]
MPRSISRRACLGLSLAAVFSTALPLAAHAEAAFPSKPVTLIVPFPAGGSTDRHLRIVAQDASKYLGQPVVVENRPGAGGTLGPATMAKTARPDGYTVSLYPLGMLRMPYMQKTNWHPIDDFTFILGLSGYTFGFTVRADSPYKTFNEYIEAARQSPGKIDYGSTGVGSSPHLLIEEIAINAGVKLNHVPYRGNADMQQALLGGHVMAQSDATGWDQFVDAGKMRLLVTFGENRTTRWPDVPTAKELGYKVVSVSPYGLAGPKGMDPAVVKVLHDAFKKALFDPASMEVMKQLNQEPAYKGSEEYKQWAEATFVKDKVLIEQLGLMAN